MDVEGDGGWGRGSTRAPRPVTLTLAPCTLAKQPSKGLKERMQAGRVLRARAASLHAFGFFGAFFHTLAFLHAREWAKGGRLQWETLAFGQRRRVQWETCGGVQLLGGLSSGFV